MKFSPYSYSKISSFVSCPRKFKYNYIDKLGVFKPSLALEKGSRVHQLLENFDKIKETKELPSYKFKLTPPESQGDVDKVAFDFMKSDLGKRYLTECDVIGDEVKFGLDAKLTPCSYYSKSAIMRGAIDKLVKIDDKLIIIDWKTGKYPAQEYHDNSQSVMYAIWAFREYPEINEIEATYVYVEHDSEHKYIFLRKYLQNYVTSYSDKIVKIEKEEEFPKIKHVLCDWCDFQEHCDKDA